MRTFTFPEAYEVFEILQPIETELSGKINTIKDWIAKSKNNIVTNRNYIIETSEECKLKVFKILIADFLMRAMKGERGSQIRIALNSRINTFDDLKYDNIYKMLMESKYRWGHEKGTATILEVVKIIEERYNWDWQSYFDLVDSNANNNFVEDPFLNVTNIAFKVRDLAISNFSTQYAAFDLHVVRLTYRLGLNAHGYDLFPNNTIEMGSNPSNKMQYLFLHKLFMKFYEESNHKISPLDMDRTLWHFGRTICKIEPLCNICPLNKICPSFKIKLSHEFTE
jgi:endonuclease III